MKGILGHRRIASAITLAVAIGAGAALAIASGGPSVAAPTDPTTGTTVTWDGNGTTNGMCTSSEDLGLTVPAGQQAWLFILTHPGTLQPGAVYQLTTNLGDTTTSHVQGNDGSVHFILFTPLGAVLMDDGATFASPGTDQSVLTVSGCQFGSPVTSGSSPISTTTNSTVDDAATIAAWSGTEAVNARAFDTSTVTPTTTGSAPPSGTVTYTLFGNGTCDGTGISQPPVTLTSAGAVPNSQTTDPLAAGSYSYKDTYSGDQNYSGSIGPCEMFSVQGASSSTTGGTTTGGTTTSGTSSGVSTSASTLSPTSAAVTSPTTSSASPSSAAGGTSSGLAFTGTNLWLPFGTGLFLIGGGSALLLELRRRRRQSA